MADEGRGRRRLYGCKKIFNKLEPTVMVSNRPPLSYDYGYIVESIAHVGVCSVEAACRRRCDGEMRAARRSRSRDVPLAAAGGAALAPSRSHHTVIIGTVCWIQRAISKPIGAEVHWSVQLQTGSRGYNGRRPAAGGGGHGSIECGAEVIGCDGCHVRSVFFVCSLHIVVGDQTHLNHINNIEPYPTVSNHTQPYPTIFMRKRVLANWSLSLSLFFLSTRMLLNRCFRLAKRENSYVRTPQVIHT